MSNSSIIDYGVWIIGFFVVVFIVGSGTYVMKYAAANYGIETGSLDIVDPDSISQMNNLTSDMTGTIQNTQTSSQSFNTIWAGISAWKLLLNTPQIIFEGSENTFNALNVNIGGFSLFSIVMVIILVTFVWTLGYFLITGRRQ